MKKKVLTTLFVLSMTVSAFAGDNVQVRKTFSDLGYSINWDNDTKTVSLNNQDNNININIDTSDNIINLNGKFYFNKGITLKDGNTFMDSDVFSYITKLSQKPVYSDEEVIEPTENNISKDSALSVATAYVNKFYNENINDNKADVTYYNDDTCDIMIEKETTTYFIKLNSLNGELVSIDKTISKAENFERGVLSAQKISENYVNGINKIDSLDNYGKLEPIFTCIPSQNNYTVVTVYKSDNGMYFAYEYSDITKEAVSIYIYDNEEKAIDSILQMV